MLMLFQCRRPPPPSPPPSLRRASDRDDGDLHRGLHELDRVLGRAEDGVGEALCAVLGAGYVSSLSCHSLAPSLNLKNWVSFS